MKQVPQHLSMTAKTEKFQTLGRLSQAGDLGWKHGFAGGGRAGGRARPGDQGFVAPAGHIITHIGDTGMHGTYMESFPAENVGKAAAIGMVDRTLHPQQFAQHTKGTG